ncbi:hypothetical protein FI667_g1089, partial [Globisporangium splendens]
MERLSLGVLAHLFELLTARDVAQLTATCTALHPREPIVQDAVALVVKHRFGDVLASLREDDPLWPRSVLVLRVAEVLTLKKWLGSASIQSYEDAASSCASKSSVIVSKAWFLAWKKRSQGYEQFLMRFRHTKKKQQQRERQLQTRSKKEKKLGMWTNGAAAAEAHKVVDTEAAATREAGDLVVCQHGDLLPVPLCVGRSKRVVISKSMFTKMSLYASDLRGFPLYSSDCEKCTEEKEAKEREVEQRRQERFESQIAGSNDLLDLLLRKSGYPNELFSPASSRGNTHLSLHHSVGKTYFLVPKKWLIKWRNFVRSLDNAGYPGPILNAELVCLAHQRNVVPPYITMFLSGFSIEQSLQATQAQYEIVTLGEWEALYDRYCAEYAVGFDVFDGSYHWQTQECNICYYGMGGSGTEKRRNASR